MIAITLPLHFTPSKGRPVMKLLTSSALLPSLLALAATLGVASSRAEAYQVLQQPYDRCGTLYSGIVCVFFLDDRGQSVSLSGDTSPYDIGDTFRVTGTLQNAAACVSTIGTVTNFTVSPCGPSEPYDQCGTLYSGIVCLFFLDDAGNSLTLGEPVPFNVFDRFRVQGKLLQGSNCVSTTGTVVAITATPCADATGDGYCYGNGGVTPACTPCPCGNDSSPLGIAGCENSTGRGCELRGSGNPSLSADTLRFEAVGVLPSTFGILTSGVTRQPENPLNPCFGLDSGVQAPVLDGLRCAGGALLRHGTRGSDAAGDIGVSNPGWGPPNGPAGGLLSHGRFAVGQTRHYQLYYRENSLLGCGTSRNTSQGVSITAQP